MCTVLQDGKVVGSKLVLEDLMAPLQAAVADVEVGNLLVLLTDYWVDLEK